MPATEHNLRIREQDGLGEPRVIQLDQIYDRSDHCDPLREWAHCLVDGQELCLTRCMVGAGDWITATHTWTGVYHYDAHGPS